MVMCLLETGWHPMTVFMMSLWTRNPTPYLFLSSFPLKKTLCPSSVVVSPKFFYLISQSPRMFHLYLSISCVSSWSFPAAVSVIVFHVPMLMLSLPWRIFDDAPVAYLTPPSWYMAEGTILVDLSGDRSGMVWLLVLITWWVMGKIQHDRAHPSPRWTHWTTGWNPSAHLALFFTLWKYPPSYAVTTPAISPITCRLVEGRSISFTRHYKFLWESKMSFCIFLQ